MNLYLPKPIATPLEIEQSPNSAREARQWCDGLSMVNMGDTAKSLFKTLQTLNRQRIDAKERLEIMEVVRPVARHVLNHLYKQLAIMTLPMPRRMSLINQLLHSILQELSVAYKLCVHEMFVKREKVKLVPQVAALACHRAMRYIGESILQHEKTYTSISEPLWHDLHRLEAFAEVEKLTQARIKDTDYRTIEHSTIPDVFKQICVLFLCQPFRLRQAELEALRRFMETGSGLVDLKKSLLADDNGAVFVVSLRSSEGPAYVPLADITTFSNLRGFDFTTFFEYLRIRKTGVTPETSVHEHLPPAMAERILHILTFQEKRRFSRVVTNRTVTVALGINNIIDAMQADTHPELPREQLFPGTHTAADAALTPLSMNAAESISGVKFETRTLYDDFFLGDADSLPASKPREAPASWSEWHIINSGTAGYGLQWNKAEPCYAHVGELIAVREKEYNIHHWRIGIVRWIRNNQPDSIDMGVQVIAPRALIVNVPTSVSGEMVHALMLPGMKPVKQPPSCVVPSNLYDVGDHLDLIMLGKNLNIELRAIGENPGTYTQFFYKARQVSQAPKQKEDFEDLWSKL